MRSCHLLIGLLLTAMALDAIAEGPFSFESTLGQLPKSVVPRHYQVHIQPDLENFTTRGSVTIDVEVLKPVREIVLNALELEITKATLIGHRKIPLKPVLDPERQTVTFKLPREIARGHHRLALEFAGRMGEQAQGLFYVKYPTPGGRKVMLATQMEPSDARRMFPCWDEPVFRATFELTVVLPEKYKAVSNLPGARETMLPGALKETIFARTPPMASYLLVLVAGELAELKDHAEGVQIRVITTEGKQEQGRYALEATKKLLTYYNRYFGLKYPLPKLDQIAIPGGFSGAMENWGGITYEESTLLFDPQTSSQQTKRDIFITVAHEMAHQWFGNLVTMAWWNNLWLNEGFASWMETKATDHFNPDWQLWLSADSDKSAVMSGDAHRTTHPIQQPVDNESEANDAFDSITYQKGAALVRMLESYLGAEQFRRGIHEYLSGHTYSNTTTADLWDALERVSGKPIQSVCAGWTEQPGLPIVNLKTECVKGAEAVEMEQERFTVQDPAAKPLLWKIPVSLMDVARPGAINTVLLEGKSASTTFPDCGAVIKANAGDTGYYRVSYDPPLLEKLRRQINQLAPADRLNLLNDGWAMVEANRASTGSYFALVESLRSDPTFAIWDQILSTLYLIDHLEQNQNGRAAFQTYARTLLRPALERLGWETKPGESSTDSLLRTKIIAGLGHFGDQTVIAEARERFEKFLAHPESLAPDLRPSVLKIVGRYSDQATYNQIHELARRAQGTEERQLCFGALAAALDPDLARATLAISLTDETVPQEATSLVIEVADLGEHPELAWDFARLHLKELLAKVDSFDRNNYVPSILSSFSDNAKAAELEDYTAKHVSEDAVVKAREAGEEIRFKAMLKQRELPVIDRWVAAHLADPAKSPK